jgi:MFS family permease
MTDVVEPTPKVKATALGANYWKLWTSSVVSNLGDGAALIAYPWLASAVTRNPVLIAVIAVFQRLPWLVFTLPAGVITDRVDRRKIMVTMQALRTVLTITVALVVLGYRRSIPSPDEIAGGIDITTNWGLYLVLVASALLFGMAEVLYDNSAQTILPAIVEPEALEKANGNLWGAEMVANSFVGPPLGSFLIALGFATPFFFDAGTFAVSAAVLFVLSGVFAVQRDEGEIRARVDWWGEIKEGFGWLWRHPLLRPMAIILGLLNMLGMVGFATFVLFAQEVLEVSPILFAVLMAAGAVGGIIGSYLAPRISKALGSGASLYLTMIVGAVTALVIGLSSLWPVVWVMFAAATFTGVLWNVITVSLRQTIIPDRLLGRVNSVYRFFGWGMMPIGLLIGGLLVSVTEAAGGSREIALRVPWFFVAGANALLFVYAAPRLTTEKIETARAEGIAAKKGKLGGVADDAIAESGVAGAPPPIDEG